MSRDELIAANAAMLGTMKKTQRTARNRNAVELQL